MVTKKKKKETLYLEIDEGIFYLFTKDGKMKFKDEKSEYLHKIVKKGRDAGYRVSLKNI